jgi:ketosteroid isomerase-like protein
MISPAQIDQLLHILATHPVLPAMELLPRHDEAMHALLAELAAGERSSYAERLSQAANAAGLKPDELARRAEFLLACLVLPQSGTYYELLGVSPQATAEEIRQRWALLIQRYHPDHLNTNTGWMAEQSRRLIEAYQTLRDAEKRRSYDVALLREPAAVTETRRYISHRHSTRTARPMQRRWMAVIVLMLSLGGLIWIYRQGRPAPLPRVALPAAPKFLETWPLPARMTPVRWPSSPGSTPAIENVVAPEPSSPEVPASRQQPTQTSDPPSAPLSVIDQAPKLPAPPVMRPEPAQPTAIAREIRALAVPDDAVPHRTDVRRSPTRPRPAVPASLPAAEPAPFPKERRPAGESQVPPPVEPPAATPAVVSMSPAAVVNLEPERTPGQALPAEDEPLLLVESFRAAYEREDLDTLMRLFAAVPKEQQAVGRVAVQALYARNFEALEQIHYELTHLESSEPGTNNALFVRGWFRIRAARRENPSQPVDAAGPVRWLLRREAQALRIAEIHYELSGR